MQSSLPTLERWPNALPLEVISQCVQQVEVALNHGNQEEAFAAIKHAFEHERKDKVTLNSSLEEVGLPMRVVNGLESAGINNVRQLIAKSVSELHKLRNMGTTTTNLINRRLGEHGFALRHDRIDDGVPEWAMRATG